MQEYEDRIQERRRAVADKECIYQALTDLNKRRSHPVKAEEYQKLKAIDKSKENAKNLLEFERQLEEIRMMNYHYELENKEL